MVHLYTLACRISTLLVCLALFTGCGSTYTYGEKTYTDRNEAESAAHDHMQSLVDQVQPRKSPILNEGIIYIADRDTVLQLGVDMENTRSEAASYVSKVMYYGFSNVASMIEKRKIFETLHTIESDGAPKQADPNGRPVIYLHMPDKGTSGWYYVSKTTEKTPLSFDFGNTDEFERYYYLVESVEDLVLQEK